MRSKKFGHDRSVSPVLAISIRITDLSIVNSLEWVLLLSNTVPAYHFYAVVPDIDANGSLSASIY